MKMILSYSKFIPLVIALLTATGWQSLTYAAPAEQPPASAPAAAKVNVNTASAEQLSEMLNGVGLKRGQAIVAYREANGPFTEVDQLLSVKGIGEATLKRNREKIVLK